MYNFPYLSGVFLLLTRFTLAALDSSTFDFNNIYGELDFPGGPDALNSSNNHEKATTEGGIVSGLITNEDIDGTGGMFLSPPSKKRSEGE